LGVPASLVGLMVAVPVLAAPFRVLIGHRSDVHQSALGWRRTPFIWKGSLYQFGGFAIMPFALLVLAGKGESGSLPVWIGQLAAGLSFLLVGIGIHVVQTTGLALATDLTPERSHPRVVGMMYVTLLIGMLVSGLLFGTALVNFTPGRLVQVVQAAAVLTLIINTIAIWKQEPRRRGGGAVASTEPGLKESWRALKQSTAPQVWYLLLGLVGLGTLAFAMADILLEPFGGQVLALDVSSTTRLTAAYAAGGLVGYLVSTTLVGRGLNAILLAGAGLLLGVFGFAAVISAVWLSAGLFLLGNVLIGFCAAVFAHSTLTVTMSRAPRDQAGLALGAWGAVQATLAGIAMACAGVGRDLVTWAVAERPTPLLVSSTADGYLVVYALEVVLLFATLALAVMLFRRFDRSLA
ncbi:MAG: MFS transporter, partial [Pseudomonadota bacterium]